MKKRVYAATLFPFYIVEPPEEYNECSNDGEIEISQELLKEWIRISEEFAKVQADINVMTGGIKDIGNYTFIVKKEKE